MKIANSLSLLFALYSLTVAAQSPDRTDLAIFFPVTEYSNGWQSLPGTKPELDSIAKDVRDLYGFYTEVHPNKSKKQIKDHLAELASRSYGPQDQLLLFFSMHGYFDEAGDAGCLVPYGGKYNDPTFDTWLLHTELRALVSRIPCEHILLVLDACYSGTFGGTKSKPEAAAWANIPDCKSRIAQALSRKTRLYLTAGGKEKVPAASDFIKKWRSALGMGGGEDGILSFSELHARLSDAYPTPREGSFSGHLGGSFMFVPKAGCGNAPSIEPGTPGKTNTPINLVKKESASDWEVFYDVRGRKGFKDKNGKITVTPRFPGNDDRFYDGLASIWFENKLGFIDTTGKVVLLDDMDIDYYEEGYSDGLRPMIGKGIKYVDKSNQVVLQTPYFDAYEFHEGLATVFESGKAGVIDKSGKVVVPFNFDNISLFDNGIASAKLNGKWGIVDRIGNIVIPLTHKWVRHVHGSRVIFASKDGKIAMFDENGKNLTQYIYSDNPRLVDVTPTRNSDQNLFPVLLKDKCGYIDNKGNEILPFIYDNAQEFIDGLAIVNNGSMIIGRNGHAVVESQRSDLKYDRMDDLFLLEGSLAFKDSPSSGWKSKYWRKILSVLDKSGKQISGLQDLSLYYGGGLRGWLLAEKNDKYGIVGHSGKLSIPVEFDSIKSGGLWYHYQDRDETFYFVWKKGKEGLCHIDGELVIPTQYDSIVFSTRPNIYAARDAGKWVFINIDRSTMQVSKFSYDSVKVDILDFSLLGSREGKWCFLDATLQEVVPPKFQSIHPFYWNRTWARIDGKWGLIDASGRELTGFVFDQVTEPSDFDGWWWVAQKNGKLGFIDVTDGSTVLDFEYEEIDEFDEDLAVAKKNGKWGAINRKGEVVINFSYVNDFYFIEGQARVTDTKGRTYYINRNDVCVNNCPK
jgi:hypothetical protein